MFLIESLLCQIVRCIELRPCKLKQFLTKEFVLGAICKALNITIVFPPLCGGQKSKSILLANKLQFFVTRHECSLYTSINTDCPCPCSEQSGEQMFCIKLLRINVSGWKSLRRKLFNIVYSGAKTYKSSQGNIIVHCLTFKYNLLSSFSAGLDFAV